MCVFCVVRNRLTVMMRGERLFDDLFRLIALHLFRHQLAFLFGTGLLFLARSEIERVDAWMRRLRVKHRVIVDDDIVELRGGAGLQRLHAFDEGAVVVVRFDVV